MAADTQMTYPDGTTHDRAKVKTLRAATGAYVISYSCLDINSAEALANDVLIDLNLGDPKSFTGVEDLVKSRLEQWASTHILKDDRPYIDFILGCRLDPTPSNSDCLALYLCQSSGIVLRKTVEDSNGYVAIGAGNVVTDSLFRTLFGPLVPPRVCLAQLSYLMYRAKKDCRGACGGMTDAALLLADNPETVWIERNYMGRAEEYGTRLDITLSRVTASIVSRNGLDDESRFADFFDRRIIRSNFGLYGFVFRTRTGEMIQ